jgi:yveN, capsular polysaccharide biosynthesis protein, glycosyl transferase family 4
MKKVLFVATVVKTHIMEFHIPYLKMFKEMGWETAVAARNDYENPADCVIPYCDTYYNIPFERNPLKPGNLKAYKELKHIIDEGEYDIIHCHTPVGAMLTRLAAKQARKKGTKVFYTAHGFHFYKGAPAINWILYYPVEKWLSRYTDVLITINKEDYERAKTFKAGKVCYVPGVGIDLKKFNAGYVNKEQKRKEIGVSADDFVLLSVGELIPRKNHEVVIRALSVLKQLDKLNHIEYVICGRGSYEADLRKLAEGLDVADHVHFLGYRNDISEICNCADLFVFMSHQEGLPVALMEAMACGLPAVCSNIRGNTDLIEDGVTGLLANNTPEEVAQSISKMKSDTALRNRVASAALQKIKQFDLSSVEDEMSKIYGGGVRNLVLQGVYKGQRIRKELGIPLNAKVILSVGEVNKNKNHKVGIEALAKLRDKNTYYVICGRGPLMEAHKELAQSLGVGDRVILTGYRTDVADFYKMADVFLFPSFREGLPVAVMEAMASGLPVVATRIRGSSDLVQQGDLFEPTDVDGIAKAIETLQQSNVKHETAVFDIHKVMESMKTIYGV